MALGSNYRALVPKPADNYTVGVKGHKLTTSDPNLALKFLGDLSQDDANSVNPMAKEIAQGQADSAQLAEQQRQLASNPAPVQAHVNGGPMPERVNIAQPAPGQANLNPLAVLLGLGAGLGGQYAPSVAGTVGNMAQQAVQQTDQDFKQRTTEAEMATNAAAQKYHDEMTARNEALKEAAMNNDIDFTNANAAFKQRGVLGGIKAAQAGVDSLSKTQTAIGQQMQNKAAIDQQTKQVKEALPDYLDMLDKATKADQGDATIQHLGAQTNALQQETADTHALQAGKIKDQETTNQLHAAQVAQTGAHTAAIQQETAESKQLLAGRLQAQRDAHEKTMADIAAGKEEQGLKRLFYQAKLAGVKTGANASDINAAMKSNDAPEKEMAGELKGAWAQYNEAEFGPNGRLKYMEGVRKMLADQLKRVPTKPEVDRALNADPVYKGLELHSSQVVQTLHQTDAAFQQAKTQAAAGRDRIMRSSKVPGAKAGGANWTAAY